MSSYSQARDILERLVAFDTVSAKSNIPLIDYVRNYLAGHGVQCQLVPTPDGQKASLFATIGDGSKPGIGLSGHTDVVPVEGQAWTSDPFKLTERGGRLYGRGSCDMKGFLACVLAMVPEYRRRSLASPIHVVFSYDEEVGCTGVRPMIKDLGKRLTRPRIVIVGEPTSMRIVDAHKGAARFRTTVTGREAHSSMAHLGVNAIHYAGLLIAELAGIEKELRAGPHNTRFTPSYTTLQVGLIEGGRAQNIVPRDCSFSWEIRALPGLDIRGIAEQFQSLIATRYLAEMRAIAEDTRVDNVFVNGIPAFYAGSKSEAVSLALRIGDQNETYAVSYGTEAGLFQEAGSSSVICGPGDIAQAHRPDEYIEIGEIEHCLAFLGRLGDWAERN
jgi:acetylornithine deacetylase